MGHEGDKHWLDTVVRTSRSTSETGTEGEGVRPRGNPPAEGRGPPPPTCPSRGQLDKEFPPALVTNSIGRGSLEKQIDWMDGRTDGRIQIVIEEEEERGREAERDRETVADRF